MSSNTRLTQIIKLVEESGFVSVADLSRIFQVTETTIRRDLLLLSQQKLIQRTHGGAYALRVTCTPNTAAVREETVTTDKDALAERIDVLITTSVDPQLDLSLLKQMGENNIPVVAESVWVNHATTLVAVNSYLAAQELGKWVGEYAQTHFNGRAHFLDLTFDLPNTMERSRGFQDGLRSILPDARLVLSINAHSRRNRAYQLAADALSVYPNINIIFAVNDATAAGALQACKEKNISPNDLLLVSFGLTGTTLKDHLVSGGHCKAGLGMFPEIVGRVCTEAAITAYNNIALPPHLITPHAILTPQTIDKYYIRTDQGWQINWESALKHLSPPLTIDKFIPRTPGNLPKRLGFVVPFKEHEWYQNLILCLRKYAGSLNIDVEVIDAETILQNDITKRQRDIARSAARQVRPGDVLFLDSGTITTFLAEVLSDKEDITVITNSISVVETLYDHPGITLISTGGILRPGKDAFTGPTAEVSLRELRAHKLFLCVAGVTLNFGLSHTNIAEVSMKQAMIRAAREVILLADHTAFGRDTVMQVGPASLIHKIISDNGLTPDHRLEFNKLGIEVIVADT